MRAKYLKMASSMNMDSDDEELLRPSIGTKTWNITPDMVESVLAVCPHASREAIKCDLNQTNSVTTTINRILDGEVASGCPFSGPDNLSSAKEKYHFMTYSHTSNTEMGVMQNVPIISSLTDKKTVNCPSDTDIDTDTDDSDIVIVKEERQQIFTSLKERLKAKSGYGNAEIVKSKVKDSDDEVSEKMSYSKKNVSPRKRIEERRERECEMKERMDGMQKNNKARTSEIQDITFTDEYFERMEVDHNSDEVVFLNVDNQKSSVKPYAGLSNTKDIHNSSEIIDLSFVEDDLYEGNRNATPMLVSNESESKHLELLWDRRACTTGGPSDTYSKITDIDIKRQQGEKIQLNKYPSTSTSEDFCLRIDSDDNSDTCEVRMTDVSASESETQDLPSVFPSMSKGTSSSQCEMISYSQDECIDKEEIPKKRKKCSSEAASKRKEEMKMLKEAKDKAKQKKKEEVEMQKLEKNQAMLTKKREKEIEKLNKKAESMNQKSQRKEDCMQAMEVCIDPALLSFNKTANADVDPIIAKLTSLQVSYSLQTQPIPECITWKRATVEHKVGDNLEIEIQKTYSDESTVIVHMEIEAFISLVDVFKKVRYGCASSDSRVPSVESFCTNLTNTYTNKTITLVIVGLGKYFRDIKTKQARQFRNAVRGDTGTAEKPKSKSRKAAQDASVLVTQVEVEELLVYLELQSDIKITVCETLQDFAELIGMFTKALAEAPFKKIQPAVFSFCVDAGHKPPVKVTKDGEGLLKLWQQQLQQYHNVSANMAAAIVSVYQSPRLLVQAYKQCANEKAAALLLKDIVVRRGEGVLATSRRIGPELSRQIYTLFNATDGQTLTK